MSKFYEAIATYKSQLEDLGISFDEELLHAVAKGLGPSIYNTDSAKVSCSDQEELNRIKDNFLKKKLGMADSNELDEAIQEICQKMGSSNRNKHRAVFYYLLVEKFDQKSKYMG